MIHFLINTLYILNKFPSIKVLIRIQTTYLILPITRFGIFVKIIIIIIRTSNCSLLFVAKKNYVDPKSYYKLTSRRSISPNIPIRQTISSVGRVYYSNRNNTLVKLAIPKNRNNELSYNWFASAGPSTIASSARPSGGIWNKNTRFSISVMGHLNRH